VFSRREKSTTTSPTSTKTDVVVESPGSGKGRATPKRRDVERERREKVKGPSDPKAARKADRQRVLAERRSRNEGMMAGDERYLPKRDLGPRRRYIREWIDGRRTAAEMFLPSAAVILVLGVFGRSEVARALSAFIWMVLAVGIVIDSTIWTMKLRKLLAQKFPNEPRKGDIAYAMMRAMLVRQMRTPRPAKARAKKA
jgi:hypothetical protein